MIKMSLFQIFLPIHLTILFTSVVGQNGIYDLYEATKGREKFARTIIDSNRVADEVRSASALDIDVYRYTDGVVDAWEKSIAYSDADKGYAYGRAGGRGVSRKQTEIETDVVQEVTNARIIDNKIDSGFTAGTTQETYIFSQRREPIQLDQLNVIDAETGNTKFVSCTTNIPGRSCDKILK
eukprot:TRINITY_DN5736_c0_g1_i1.p3 TRINITY_DN5736_c0_g1~~TRINITY_DN5736_c0_g1_i1.p3  ORF type:complete len:181 (+),score=17.56 TRINITY_DN5736_c0_g1_i1:60-602(+)